MGSSHWFLNQNNFLFISSICTRAGNSLIWFPSEALVFCPKMSEWAIHSLIFGERPERFAHDWSFPLGDLSKLLMVAHFWWAKWAIRSHHSFNLSEMSVSITLLTKKEDMSENERFAHFFEIFFLKNLI